jgi:hypothetical protein
MYKDFYTIGYACSTSMACPKIKTFVLSSVRAFKWNSTDLLCTVTPEIDGVLACK